MVKLLQRLRASWPELRASVEGAFESGSHIRTKDLAQALKQVLQFRRQLSAAVPSIEALCDSLEDATEQVRQREEERLRFKAMTRDVLDGQNKGILRQNWNDTEKISMAPAQGRGDTSFAGQPAAGSKNKSSGGSGKNDMRQTPRLERNVQIRLQFQSPEIYNTDIGAEQRGQGRIYGCKSPDADGIGEAVMLHPEIALNALPPIFGGKRGVHVHLEDLTDHKVFWDADFKLPMFDPIMNIVGKTRIKKTTAPMNMADQFHKPCVPKDDMRPHFFDLSIRTLGKYWDDIVEEWRPNKGFKDNGPEAHIGFLVQRMPKLSADGKEEMLGVWKRKGSPIAAEGDVIQDPFERALAGHEDPFYEKSKGTTRRGYYDHIINRRAEPGLAEHGEDGEALAARVSAVLWLRRCGRSGTPKPDQSRFDIEQASEALERNLEAAKDMESRLVKGAGTVMKREACHQVVQRTVARLSVLRGKVLTAAETVSAARADLAGARRSSQLALTEAAATALEQLMLALDEATSHVDAGGGQRSRTEAQAAMTAGGESPTSPTSAVVDMPRGAPPEMLQDLQTSPSLGLLL
ncbi:unnamed protein product [Symbiodinium necroappetens]|uniref:Uncharacterized protein n=1 Tax=Symbiodinium necroappetens TaxID=1628268 RepID=A0A812W1T5_9DINO|nr:unnamed protein product [Symbiodinium necroappetens]